MKRLLSKVLLMTMVIGMVGVIGIPNVTAATFAGGSGTEQDPYQVSTPDQLNAVRDYLDCWFIQINDINMTAPTAFGGAYYYGGKGWLPIGDGTAENRFTGTYDGGGFEIIGLKIDRNGDAGNCYVGLFGYSEGDIINLGMADGNIKGASASGYFLYVGSIAGYNSGAIRSCYNTSAVSSSTSSASPSTSYFGGIVGSNDGGVIAECYNTGNISASSPSASCASGIAGYSRNGTITDCYNTGEVSVSSSNSDSLAGGIIGSNTNSTIINCHNIGNVSATVSAGSFTPYAGGIVGYNCGIIRNCYNAGVVSASISTTTTSSGSSHAGGISGYNGSTHMVDVIIMNCYNTGQIYAYSSNLSGSSGASYAGGVAGRNVPNIGGITIMNCYNTGEVSSSHPLSVASNVGGIAGASSSGVTHAYCYWNIDSNQTVNGSLRLDTDKKGIGYTSSSATTSKTSEEMKQPSFVALLNDIGTWELDTLNINDGYPILGYQMQSGEGNDPRNINVDITNYATAGSIPGVIVITAYDRNGTRLTNKYFENISPEATSVKIMIWDSLKAILPLMAPVEIE